MTIEWVISTRDDWNEHVGPEGFMYDPAYALVVSGVASCAGERVGLVYGPVCCANEADSYIDTVLSPAMNAQLDERVGPRAWRAESVVPARKL